MSTTVTTTGSAGSSPGYSFGDLIEKVYRRLMSGASEITVQLGSPSQISAGSMSDTIYVTQNGITTSMVFSGPASAAIVPGAILAIENEMLLVLSTSTVGSNIAANVERGYMGSAQASHLCGVLVYINPSVSRFDIGVAINDDLSSLSANGLVRIDSAAVTYNPVFMGYDLGSLPTNFIEILEIRYQHPFPDKRYPPITRWKVSRNQDTSVFPSGNSLTIFEPGFPGMPMIITYSAPLIPLVATSDNVCYTPATNDPNSPYNGYSNNETESIQNTITYVPNLPTTAVDIPPLGAMIQLVGPREFTRNNFLLQPDPRKSTDVTPGAIMNSVQRMEIFRQKRIEEEVARLRKQYTRSPVR